MLPLSTISEVNVRVQMHINFDMFQIVGRSSRKLILTHTHIICRGDHNVNWHGANSLHSYAFPVTCIVTGK